MKNIESFEFESSNMNMRRMRVFQRSKREEEIEEEANWFFLDKNFFLKKKNGGQIFAIFYNFSLNFSGC